MAKLLGVAIQHPIGDRNGANLADTDRAIPIAVAARLFAALLSIAEIAQSIGSTRYKK